MLHLASKSRLGIERNEKGQSSSVSDEMSTSGVSLRYILDIHVTSITHELMLQAALTFFRKSQIFKRGTYRLIFCPSQTFYGG